MFKITGARGELMRAVAAVLIGCAVAAGQGNQNRRSSEAAQKRTPGLEQTDKAWLAAPAVPREAVTGALNALTAADAAQAAAAYSAARERASSEGRHAAGLLAGAALELANDSGRAAEVYGAVVAEAANTPYAVSAAFRRHAIEQAAAPPSEADKSYEKIAAETEAEGWFRLPGGWGWTTTRRAAWQALVGLRSSYLSFRLFAFLREKSLFPPHLSYLFVLLVLGVGTKLLALPLYFKGAQFMGGLRRLQPEIEHIQRAYGDTGDAQQRINALYREHGLNPLAGCAVVALDWIFVVWAFYALSSFAPQLALDGARFWWVADVTQRDLYIMLAWAGCSLLALATTSQWQDESAGQTSCGFLVMAAAVVAGGWYWQLPAYVFIFWSVLILVGLFLHLVLAPVRGAAAS